MDNQDDILSPLEYLGPDYDKSRTWTVTADFAAQLHHQMLERNVSARDVAAQASLLDEQESAARRDAHGHKRDCSGLCLSVMGVTAVRNVALYGTTATIHVTIYWLLCRWLGIAPVIPKGDAVMRLLYEGRWLPMVHAELARQAVTA